MLGCAARSSWPRLPQATWQPTTGAPPATAFLNSTHGLALLAQLSVLWPEEEMSHVTFPPAQAVFSPGAGADGVLQELLPCPRTVLA